MSAQNDFIFPVCHFQMRIVQCFSRYVISYYFNILINKIMYVKAFHLLSKNIKKFKHRKKSCLEFSIKKVINPHCKTHNKLVFLKLSAVR